MMSQSNREKQHICNVIIQAKQDGAEPSLDNLLEELEKLVLSIDDVMRKVSPSKINSNNNVQSKHFVVFYDKTHIHPTNKSF